MSGISGLICTVIFGLLLFILGVDLDDETKPIIVGLGAAILVLPVIIFILLKILNKKRIKKLEKEMQDLVVEINKE